MDANGLRFWNLADATHWFPWPGANGAPSGVEYDSVQRMLRLANQRPAPSFTEVEADATAHGNLPSQVRDAFGTRAWWDAAANALHATGARDGIATLALPASAKPPSDLAIGFDDVLYVARSGPVQLVDLRGRWPATEVSVPGFTAVKLTADPTAGAWALDREHGALARLTGQPPRAVGMVEYNAGTFRPCVDNENPPKLVGVPEAVLPAGEKAITIACSAAGRVALLTWKDGADACIRFLTAQHQWSAARSLQAVKFPYSLTWIDDEHVAVLLTGAKEALVYAAADESEESSEDIVLPTGDFFPLIDATDQPFVHGVDVPPQYPSTGGTKPLLRLSLPSFATAGQAANYPKVADVKHPPALIDSGAPTTQWHRIYLEAALPLATGVRMWLATSNNKTPPLPEQSNRWHLHLFGGADFGAVPETAPRAVWMKQPSELPFHPGLLPCPSQAQRNGLFTVLIQRAGFRARTLVGRYLWVRVELIGNGRASPQVAALRAYGSRFSYRDRYLPELYRETVFGPDAEAQSVATPADFLERFLDNFEGVLTPLEDRIASSYLLTDAATVPEDALSWLASWIGLAFDAAYPSQQRRVLLEAAPYLYRLHGTQGGLRAALEIASGGSLRRARLARVGERLPAPGEVTVIADGATSVKGLVLSTSGVAGVGDVVFLVGGAVSGGSIVVVEHFRMRRVLATILGAHLEEDDDPLLPGLTVSGNSFIGDTLTLGDQADQVLALFSAALPRTTSEQRAIAALYDDLAYRASVLVHNEIGPQDFGLLRRVANAAAPVHVSVNVAQATYAFLVSIASLVAVDTYLSVKLAPQPMRVDGSYVGVRDVLHGPATLDPRTESAGTGAAPGGAPQ